MPSYIVIGRDNSNRSIRHIDAAHESIEARSGTVATRRTSTVDFRAVYLNCAPNGSPVTVNNAS